MIRLMIVHNNRIKHLGIHIDTGTTCRDIVARTQSSELTENTMATEMIEKMNIALGLYYESLGAEYDNDFKLFCYKK